MHSSPASPSPLRPALQALSFPMLALLLACAFIAMRVMGTLGPLSLFWMLPLSFSMMAALPWILLSPYGRRSIGLQVPSGKAPYALALTCGVAAALLCFTLGMLLYGATMDNWFVSIATSFRRTAPTAGLSIWMLHLMITVPACIFSPIGEEIFFRGVLQNALEEKLSVRSSTCVEAGLFGLVHLCHHGLSVTATGVSLNVVPAAVWVALMFATACLFAWLRRRHASLWPAMAAHAAFNLTMNAVIFQFLWPTSPL